MDGLAAFLTYPLGFAVVLTVVVFVHELGHYWVARRCGVRVEVFSIGFGPELIGRTDKRGTRWKLSAIPFGGYVKMFGDAGAASTPGEGVAAMSEEERRVAFHHKRLGQRAAIVAARANCELRVCHHRACIPLCRLRSAGDTGPDRIGG